MATTHGHQRRRGRGRSASMATWCSPPRSPLLMLAAGADFTQVDVVTGFAEQARAAGVEADVEVFPEAPHSFFDRTFAEHREACEQAWRVMLDFIDTRATA